MGLQSRYSKPKRCWMKTDLSEKFTLPGLTWTGRNTVNGNVNISLRSVFIQRRFRFSITWLQTHTMSSMPVFIKKQSSVNRALEFAQEKTGLGQGQASSKTKWNCRVLFAVIDILLHFTSLAFQMTAPYELTCAARPGYLPFDMVSSTTA